MDGNNGRIDLAKILRKMVGYFGIFVLLGWGCFGES
jgi:hypothetical protein